MTPDDDNPQPDEQICEQCSIRYSVSQGEILHEPDPYAEEIHHDHTLRWLCIGCRRESCRDI